MIIISSVSAAYTSFQSDHLYRSEQSKTLAMSIKSDIIE